MLTLLRNGVLSLLRYEVLTFTGFSSISLNEIDDRFRYIKPPHALKEGESINLMTLSIPMEAYQLRGEAINIFFGSCTVNIEYKNIYDEPMKPIKTAIRP
jgi:hypothetical protein